MNINTEQSSSGGRVYQRKFDWDEARRLRSQGLAYEEIGRRLGVTYRAYRRRKRARLSGAERKGET